MDKFSFDGLKLIESHFTLNTNFKPTKNEPIDISFQIGISHKKEDNRVNVTVSVSSANKSQPFIFDVAIMGTFKFSKLPPKKELERVANINCAAIIFPYVRETIADITRRAGIPAFHMEPINFVALYNEQEAEPPSKNKKGPRRELVDRGIKSSEIRK
jgi:preprotein translocase subunit SecB